MMRVFMVMLCSLMAVCSVSARISRREGMDGQAAIYRLPLFERAVVVPIDVPLTKTDAPMTGWLSSSEKTTPITFLEV